MELKANVQPAQNESPEHFLLKQVGQAWLKTQYKCQYVGTEITVDNYMYLEAQEKYPDYKIKRKRITDVLGIRKSYSNHKAKYTIRNIEVKVSNSDLKNGFSLYGDYVYIMAPKDVIDKDLLMPFIGLIEVDLDRLKWPTYSSGKAGNIIGVKCVKNPRRNPLDYKINNVNYTKATIFRKLVNRNVYNNPWFYPDFNINDLKE